MSFTVRHGDGSTESDPPVVSLAYLLREVDDPDGQHPDVAVGHDSGWTLRYVRGELLVWENAGAGAEPRHMADVDGFGALLLFTLLAAGRVEAVEAYPWRCGHGPPG